MNKILPRLFFRDFAGAAGALAAVMPVVLTLAACSPAEPQQVVTTTPIPASVAGSAVVSSEEQTLPPDQMRRLLNTNPDQAYRLGPDDVISVAVISHPEIGNLTNVLVTSDGTVSLPLAGSVALGGKTIAQAQALLAQAYAKYFVMPDVSVQLVEPRSLRYYLLGSFTTPGIKYPGHAMTLLEALALGGSVNIAQSDLYQAYVANGSTKLPVDLHALLVDGDLSQNIVLAPGSSIVIPPAASENAFIFGSVSKPGAEPFLSGQLSLLQALSMAGMDLNSYTAARLEQVHIIRSEGGKALFIVVDAKALMDGKAAPFALHPGDIVFVPPTRVASWNEALGMLLPSLNTISGALNPFVSIKYLSQKDTY